MAHNSDSGMDDFIAVPSRSLRSFSPLQDLMVMISLYIYIYVSKDRSYICLTYIYMVAICHNIMIIDTHTRSY